MNWLNLWGAPVVRIRDGLFLLISLVILSFSLSVWGQPDGASEVVPRTGWVTDRAGSLSAKDRELLARPATTTAGRLEAAIPVVAAEGILEAEGLLRIGKQPMFFVLIAALYLPQRRTDSVRDHSQSREMVNQCDDRI